jgi:hypothetical protein
MGTPLDEEASRLTRAAEARLNIVSALAPGEKDEAFSEAPWDQRPQDRTSNPRERAEPRLFIVTSV